MSEKSENPFEKQGLWFALKQKGIEQVLGPLHQLAGSSVLPYSPLTQDGMVDMYYFRDALPGTAMATMQLIGEPGTAAQLSTGRDFELLAFTKHDYIKSDNSLLPFNRIERRMCHIFSRLASISESNILSPGDTCEIPKIAQAPGACLVISKYKPEGLDFHIGVERYHLFLVMEVFRDEMEFAMENGLVELFQLLNEKGHFPYSDLDRESVIV